MIELSNEYLEETRKRILGYPLTKEWFEEQSLSQLYEESIVISPKLPDLNVVTCNSDESCIIREDVLEVFPQEFSDVVVEEILIRTLLGTSYFHLRGKNFLDVILPKFNSLGKEVSLTFSTKSEANEGYKDHLLEKFFGRKSPIADDIKQLIEASESKSAFENFLYTLTGKYEFQRSAAVLYYFSKEMAKRGDTNNRWSRMNGFIRYTCVQDGIDLSHYILLEEKYGLGKHLIKRLENFRLGGNGFKTYKIPVI